MRAQLNERQLGILDMLNRQGEVKVGELSGMFRVAEMTIRRDLEKMEQHGYVHRTFGGAIPVPAYDIALRDRTGVLVREKERIGRTAADLIGPGEAIFLDAGTTTLQIARFLPPHADLTIVTNAINIATELLDKKVPTIVVGGILRQTTASLTGPAAEETVRQMAFDRVFLGATGLTAEHGFSNSNVLEAQLKRIVMHQSDEVNVVMDCSKFGIRSFASFAQLNQVARLVTDQLPPPALRESCIRAGMEICCAG